MPWKNMFIWSGGIIGGMGWPGWGPCPMWGGGGTMCGGGGGRMWGGNGPIGGGGGGIPWPGGLGPGRGALPCPWYLRKWYWMKCVDVFRNFTSSYHCRLHSKERSRILSNIISYFVTWLSNTNFRFGITADIMSYFKRIKKMRVNVSALARKCAYYSCRIVVLGI